VFDFMRSSFLFFGIRLVHCMYDVVGWVSLVCFYGLRDISGAGVLHFFIFLFCEFFLFLNLVVFCLSCITCMAIF
jgi:hypothetical protein